MKKTCFFLLLLLLPYCLWAQVKKDTVIYLDPIGITAFELGGEELEKPVNVAKLDSRQLQAYDNTSLLPALNIIPGVSMDSRGHGGSTRLSIRGSALRSPFGVRNVKVYYNGIPLTVV